MNVVDSSGWLEYFTNSPNASAFAPAIEDLARLAVPSIVVLEVFKKTFRERGELNAFTAAALMRKGRVIPLEESLALDAAMLGLEHRLPLADSIILATARSLRATLWTQDADFRGLPGVRFFPKRN